MALFFFAALFLTIRNTRPDSSGRLAGAPYLRKSTNNNMKNNKNNQNNNNDNKTNKSGGSSPQGDEQGYSYEV